MGAATLSASSSSPTVSWASGTLLSGAVDPDGDALTARVVHGPQHGTLSINGSGQLTYTATSGYTGIDSSTYEAFDGQIASSNTGVMNIDISISSQLWSCPPRQAPRPPPKLPRHLTAPPLQAEAPPPTSPPRRSPSARPKRTPARAPDRPHPHGQRLLHHLLGQRGQQRR